MKENGDCSETVLKEVLYGIIPQLEDSKKLVFKELTMDDLPKLRPYLSKKHSLSCDYSIGGIYMWIDFFNYHYCILEDTLFIKGVAEDNVKKTAFSLPMGKMGISQSVKILKDYCKENNIQLEFTVIPEEHIEQFKALNPKSITPLEQWYDYIYDASTLANLSGKSMGKKRNHVNKFLSLYPNYEFTEITPQNLDKVKASFKEICDNNPKQGTAEFERKQTWCVLDHLNDYQFESGVLLVNDKVVSFCLGEIIEDVLLVHIEKTMHEYEGANEMINKLFAEKILNKYRIKYINREDDSGDEGLKFAKMSYHPSIILKKYNVIF